MWSILAQTVPESGGDWITSILTGTVPATATAAVLWKIHNDHIKRAEARETGLRAENRQLQSRLFLLADRGMAVGQTASEIAASEKPKSDDPELTAAVNELRALLQQRGDA